MNESMNPPRCIVLYQDGMRTNYYWNSLYHWMRTASSFAQVSFVKTWQQLSDSFVHHCQSPRFRPFFLPKVKCKTKQLSLFYFKSQHHVVVALSSKAIHYSSLQHIFHCNKEDEESYKSTTMLFLLSSFIITVLHRYSTVEHWTFWFDWATAKVQSQRILDFVVSCCHWCWWRTVPPVCRITFVRV